MKKVTNLQLLQAIELNTLEIAKHSKKIENLTDGVKANTLDIQLHDQKIDNLESRMDRVETKLDRLIENVALLLEYIPFSERRFNRLERTLGLEPLFK